VTAHTLTEKQSKITFAFEKDSFYKLNASATGFYRVNYSVAQLSQLGKSLAANIKQFPVEDRLGLLIDVFACASSGVVPTSGALELIKAYKDEEEYIVLNEIAMNLANLESIWYNDSKTTAAIAKLITSVLKDKVAALGFDYAESDSFNVSQKRTLVITRLALVHDESYCELT
jgi:aminopeptidase N